MRIEGTCGKARTSSLVLKEFLPAMLKPASTSREAIEMRILFVISARRTQEKGLVKFNIYRFEAISSLICLLISIRATVWELN